MCSGDSEKRAMPRCMHCDVPSAPGRKMQIVEGLEDLDMRECVDVAACEKRIASKIGYTALRGATAVRQVLIGGKPWNVANLAAIVREYDALLPAKRPRFLLGCERCASICRLLVDDCACCQVYKTKSGGGTTVFYPDDGKHHVQLMPMDKFIEAVRSRVA